MPDRKDALAKARSKCERDWRDDFFMQREYPKQHEEAFDALARRCFAERTREYRAMRKCLREWFSPGTLDLRHDLFMANECVKQQVQAIRYLDAR